MLEAGGGDGEVEGLLRVVVGEETVDEAAHEGIASADAVDDVGDVVAGGLIEGLAVEEDAAPGVVVGVDGAA